MKQQNVTLAFQQPAMLRKQQLPLHWHTQRLRRHRQQLYFSQPVQKHLYGSAALQLQQKQEVPAKMFSMEQSIDRCVGHSGSFDTSSSFCRSFIIQQQRQHPQQHCMQKLKQLGQQQQQRQEQCKNTVLASSFFSTMRAIEGSSQSGSAGRILLPRVTPAPFTFPKCSEVREHENSFGSGQSRVLNHFSALLKKGSLEPSEPQKKLMLKLQALANQLEDQETLVGDDFDPSIFHAPSGIASATATTPQSFGRSLFPRWWNRDAALNAAAEKAPSEMSCYSGAVPMIRGLYIYGGVGQGKTMIMDAFFDCLRVKRKLRIHFHEFMTVDVQQSLHKLKLEKRCSDPLFEVAKQIRARARVLCFDEFQVVHITDAMILKRLFDALFSLGAVMVATSNRAPKDLYAGGLNRDRFLPFIDLLQEKCEIYHIETHKDYRLSKLSASHNGLYATPSRPIEEIEKQFKSLTPNLTPRPGAIQIAMGRVLQVPLMADGVSLFRFSDLCEAAVGPADYVAIAQNFHTVFLCDIPNLEDHASFPNEIRRFITLIDVFYEKRTRMIFDAAAPPLRLLGTTETSKEFEAFRQILQKKFKTLEDFICLLIPFCQGAAPASRTIAEDKWISAAQAVAGISEQTAKHVFETLDKYQKKVIPIETLRGALYFHMRNFDDVPPNEQNLFLFGGREISRESFREIGYELYNEGASDGAHDNQFAYVRAISRIRDMISTAYLEAHQKAHKLNDLNAFGF